MCAYSNNCLIALMTGGRKELLKVFLAENLSLLLYESNVNQWDLAVGVRAVEVVGTPLLIQSQHEGSPV